MHKKKTLDLSEFGVTVIFNRKISKWNILMHENLRM